MEKVPHDKYSKELREEAVPLMAEGGMIAFHASKTLAIPKSTLENWLFTTRQFNFVFVIVNRGQTYWNKKKTKKTGI